MFLLTNLLIAQDLPIEKRRSQEEKKRAALEKRAAAEKDTSRTRTPEADAELEEASPDSSDKIPVESNLYWYDLEERLSEKSDTSRFKIYEAQNEKDLIYKDMSDILQNQPLWIDFNLAETGRPSYLTNINLYPHQTSFYYNRIYMNDALQGMFNSQFIPLNFIQSTELDQVRGNRRNFGMGMGNTLDVTSNSEQFQEPWTRIVYKQGSYGYSDLDISFSVPFTSTFAMQLGGLNRFFDGSIPDSDFKAENYRGEFTWQYSKSLYIRTQIFLNRSKVGLASFDPNQTFATPRNIEHRDDVFIDGTWIIDDSTRQRFHFLLYHSFYERRFKDSFTEFTFVNKSMRYGIDLNYNLFLGGGELLVGAGFVNPEVYGDTFNEKSTIPSFNTYGNFNLPLNKNISFRAALQASFVKDFDPQFIPGVGLDFIFSKEHFASFDITSGTRNPNVTERFWALDSLKGNPDLEPEKYLTFSTRYRYRPSDAWQIGIDLGYQRIEKEIIWSEPQFLNGENRDFAFLAADGQVKLWKFTFGLGGQYTMSDFNLTPEQSAWGNLHFHESFLKGALIFDAYGMINYEGSHHNILYQVLLDRFYSNTGLTDSFYTFNWKLAATIQTIQIFFEMDNTLSTDYQIVFGYINYLRFLRFGINWILWD